MKAEEQRSRETEGREISWRYGLLIFGIALAGRLFGVFHSTLFERITSDSRVFDEIAQNLLAGRGFYSEYEPARSFRPPLYPFFLACIYGVAGHRPAVVPVVQAILGTGVAVLAFIIGTQQFGSRVGLLAGAGVALYPLLLVLPNGLLTENVYIILLLIVFLLALKCSQQPTFQHVILTGFIAGLAALTRPVALPFPVFFLIGLLMSHQMPWRAALKTAVLLTAVLLLTILPWTIRNYVVHHRLVLIATEGGITFWAANNSLVKPDHYQAPEITRLAERFEPYDEIELERLGWQQGFQFVRENPSTYLILCGRRFITYWSSFFPFLKYRIPWIGLLILAGVGGMIAVRIWRKAIWCYLVILWHLVVYIPLGAEPRYHIPLIPILLIFAAVALDQAYRSIRHFPAYGR